MTQSDIDNGVVNVVVGFAPLRPSEFVFITVLMIVGVGRKKPGRSNPHRAVG